jgi:hypothetical protein
MKINKPLFIIGTGRCGSTIFTELLSLHPNIAFMSSFCDKYPERPGLNRMMMRLIDIPILQPIIKKRVTPQENWGFWRHFAIAGVYRDLFKEDVTPIMKSNIQKIMAKLVTKKRNRLLLKLTGWPRIGFFKEIFPTSKFIHIIRDGRAVVNSTINTDWWEGWTGPHRWGWGKLSYKEKKEWEKYNESFVALAGIHWKRIMDAYTKAKKNIPSTDYLEIKYEQFCSETNKTLQQVIEFCELDWLSKYETNINRYRLNNMNNKWEEQLTEEQKKILCKCLENHLDMYGYKL